MGSNLCLSTGYSRRVLIYRLYMLRQWLPRNHAVERVLPNKILHEQEYAEEEEQVVLLG